MQRPDEAWKSKELARKFLDNVRAGIPCAAEQIEAMLRVINARGEPVASFADLGCGDGVLAATLLGRYPSARGVLVDFSEPMLEAARERLGNHAERLSFVLADLGHDGWTREVAQAAPFDVVVSGYAIHHQPDARKRALYEEIFRLLRAGGMFVNIEHVASSTRWLEVISDDLLIDSLYAHQRGQDGAKSREEVARECVHRPDKVANILAPVEVQCDWLRAIGFEDVDCYFKVFELAVFGGRRKKGPER